MRSFLLLILCLLVVGVGVLARRAPTAFARGCGPQGTVLRILPPPFPGRPLLRLVLIGADDREDRGRSDTLMVLFLNPELPRAALMSIPRDLKVDIPGHLPGKINHAYRFGGAPLTKQTVENLLGETIDGTVTVNLQGFVKAVDTLGGVDLDVEDVEGKGRGMNYDCPQDGLVIHLRPGRQHLNGYKAMGYVRYRKSNIPGCGGSDFQRAERQQKFLRAVLDQKLKPGHFRQLLKAGGQVWRCVRTNLTLRDLLDLARCLKAMGPGDLKTMTLPTQDATSGSYHLDLAADAFQQMLTDIQQHLAGEQVALAVTPRVEVLNASGKHGAAATAGDKLRAAGFDVLRVGNAPAYGQPQTTILYRSDSKPMAERAAQTLGCGVLEYDDNGPTPVGQAHLQVLVGKDFAGAN